MAKHLAYSIIGQRDDSKIEFMLFHQNYLYEDFIIENRPCENGFELKLGIYYRVFWGVWRHRKCWNVM